MSRDSKTSCAAIGSSRRIAHAAMRWRVSTEREPYINAGHRCSARWLLARAQADFSPDSWRFRTAERIWRWSAYVIWDDSSHLALAAPARSWNKRRRFQPTLSQPTGCLSQRCSVWGRGFPCSSIGLRFCSGTCRYCGRVGGYARKWLIDFPVSVVRSKFVQYILASYAFRVLQDYAFRPILLTAFLALFARAVGFQLSHRVWLELTLIAALFLNSALGRFVVEVSTQYLVRVWCDLRIHVIGSLAQLIMDVFRGLVTTLERMINLIDEWLRLRRGSSGLLRTFKMLGSMLWFVIAYVVIFVFTLLVEPQINPIKHFPVVTVSHKLILPTGPAIAHS